MSRNQRKDALVQRAHQEQRKRAARVGEVAVYFHKRQTPRRWWRPWSRASDFIRVYEESRVEIRSTNSNTFLAVIMSLPEDGGVFEHVFNWEDVDRVVTVK